VDWPDQLGLDLAEERVLRLDRLDVVAVRAVVERSPLASLPAAHLDEVVTQLATHSGGDPFYLRDLIRKVEDAEGDPAAIAAFPLEHSAYLQQWWNDGRIQVGAEEFTDLMGTLAAAREGLTRTLLVDISSEDQLRGTNIAA